MTAVTAYPWELGYQRPAWLHPKAYALYDEYTTTRDHVNLVWNNPYSPDKDELAGWMRTARAQWDEMMAYNATLPAPVAVVPAPVVSPVAPRLAASPYFPPFVPPPAPPPPPPPPPAPPPPPPPPSPPPSAPAPFTPPAAPVLFPPPSPPPAAPLTPPAPSHSSTGMGSLEEVDSYLATQGYTLERASGAGNNCFFYAIANALAGLPGSRLGLNDKNFAETLRADVAKLQRKNPGRYGRQVRDTPTAKVR